MAAMKNWTTMIVLTLLVCIWHVSFGPDANETLARSRAITADDNDDSTSSLPDFDGDGTVGFGDFVIFAGVFGSSQGDEKYDGRYDLSGDGEVGLPDFVIFARNFGKDVPSPVVSIPDDNLRAVIEDALGKASGAPITQAEMATLDSLYAGDADISDLTGLQYAVNLTWLSLSSNDVTDLSVLEGLTNLTYLNLSGNDISDLASLVANKGLGERGTVDVTENPLNDASRNTNIPALQARGVVVTYDIPRRVVTIPDASLRTVIETVLGKAAGTPITQADMATMDSLVANGREISDLTGLESAANLTFLSLYGNEITDISMLASLKNLKELLLSHNRIADISKLAGLTNVTSLWLWENRIENISALSSLINLTRLSLGHNRIKDVSALFGLSNLNVLFLKGNDISDLAALAANKGLSTGDIVDVLDNPLNAATLSLHIPALQARGVTVSFVPSPDVVIRDAKLRSAIWRALDRAGGTRITVADMEILTDLVADKSQIRDLTGLEAAANLTFLDFGENNIGDLSPLAGLTNLTRLNLESNNIKDLSPLAGLNSLTRLNLRSNNIKDLSPLAGLTNLMDLDLFYNNASNLSPLAGLNSLTRLNLRSNNVKNLSPLAGLTNLRNLDLRSNAIRVLSPLAGLTSLMGLNLRYNNVRDLSPLAGLTNLTDLSLGYNNVRDLSPLAGLTNLIDLDLWSNNIEDLSPLAGLTKISSLGLAGNHIADLLPLAGLADLTLLWLTSNPIADLSPLERLTALEWLLLGETGISNLSALSGLANLTFLKLTDNRIADVSPLAGLTNLTWLELGLNDLTDVSPLGGLVSLNVLELQFNRISDISALAGLTGLSRLDLRGNPLSDASVNNHVHAIKSDGVTVLFDSFVKGDYDIELVFLSKFSERQKHVIQYAARRWMAVIRDDLPDYKFTEGWSGSCVGKSFKVRTGEKIDDLRIYVWTVETGAHVWYGHAVSGFGGPTLLRNDTHLPVVGCMAFDLKGGNLLDVALHEIGHVLGFGTVWGNLDFLRYLGGDTHFDGPLATAAFDEAGGTNYQGEKVPVTHDGVHWRVPVVEGEIMASIPGVLSAITVQSLADLGYRVDVTQADAYTLPDYRPGAKIAVTLPSPIDPGMDITRLNGRYPDYGDQNVQGETPEVPALIGGLEGWMRRLVRAEAVWGGGPDSGYNVQTGRLVPSVHAEPELTCGAGHSRESIYVVDSQGRVIETIVR